MQFKKYLLPANAALLLLFILAFSVFSGALLSSAAPASYEYGQTSELTADTYTVTFYPENDEEDIVYEDVEYGTTITAPSVTKEGYTLVGWFADPEDEDTIWNFEEDTVTEDLELWATWTINTFTVTFHPKNGGENIVLEDVEYGTLLVKPSITRSNYTLIGWFADLDDEDTIWDFEEDAVTEDIDLLAKWEYSGGGSGGGGTVTYIVTFNSNGGSNVASKTVATGTKVAKPADPTKEGFTFGGWYTEAALTTVYNFDALVTKSFTLYAKWTVEGEEEEEEEGDEFFTDVTEDKWFYEDVKYVFAAGLMDGTGNNLFSPGLAVTRAMLVTVLYRMEKSPEVEEPASFSDVPAGTWYTDAVAWAEANGIVEGYPDGTFKPNQNVTRQELATVLLRYAKFIGKDQFSASPDDPVLGDGDEEDAEDEILDSLSDTDDTDDDLDFVDAAKIGDWAKEGVAFCVKNGIIQGRPGNIFDPTASANRGELAAMLHRFLENIE